MSKINVDTWEPESGTAATLMATGDTVTVPSGASLVVASGATINITGATQTGFPTGGLLGLVVYTGDGTYTKGGTSNGTAGDEGSADVTKVIIEVQGGGGGGGSSPSSYPEYSLGGSGGGYAKKFIDVSSVTASVITVGAAGVGFNSSLGGQGTDGGDSSWVDTASGGSSTVTGVKGVGGYASYGIVVGGSATGGDINIKGGDAGWGGQYGTLAGASILGMAGKNGYVTSGISTAGGGYGAGGGGRYINYPASNASPGIVLIWEYA
jgi:hypothetical protein